MAAFLVGKPEGKGPHGKSWHRWEDNIRMDLAEYTDQWQTLMNVIMTVWVP
jgi:hypothetical protein